MVDQVRTTGSASPALVEELSVELIARGGRVWRRVVSDSMTPMLLRGDRILVERCAMADARFGDIIVFRSPEGLVAHRVVWVRRGPAPLLVEKGDDNPFAGSVVAEALVGRVRRVERAGRGVDLLHGRGRRAQIVAALLSLAELVILAAGRAFRRVLHIAQPTGVATRVVRALRAPFRRPARVLDPPGDRGGRE